MFTLERHAQGCAVAMATVPVEWSASVMRAIMVSCWETLYFLSSFLFIVFNSFLTFEQVMIAHSPVVIYPAPSRTTLRLAVCLQRAGSWSKVAGWAMDVGSCHHMPMETHSILMAVRWGRQLQNRWTSLGPGTGTTKTYKPLPNIQLFKLV